VVLGPIDGVLPGARDGAFLGASDIPRAADRMFFGVQAVDCFLGFQIRNANCSEKLHNACS
jgi:hypothetical protein